MPKNSDINLKDSQIKKRIKDAKIIGEDQEIIYFAEFSAKKNENYALLIAMKQEKSRFAVKSKTIYFGFLVYYNPSVVEKKIIDHLN
jgi:hypothetical protein